MHHKKPRSKGPEVKENTKELFTGSAGMKPPNQPQQLQAGPMEAWNEPLAGVKDHRTTTAGLLPEPLLFCDATSATVRVLASPNQAPAKKNRRRR